MPNIQLTNKNRLEYTLIPNSFIDTHMGTTNGEFVKVYILLLRLIAKNSTNFNLKEIADILNILESDVLRAVNYFASKKLLSVDYNDNGELVNITFENETEALTNTTAVNKSIAKNYTIPKSKPSYSASQLNELLEQAEFGLLVKYIQQCFGRPFTKNELETIASFYHWLNLPIDVLYTLFDTCMDNGHYKLNYIEKVAIDWSDHNIKTKKQAQDYTLKRSSKYNFILKSLGILGRSIIEKEAKIIDSWYEKYSFTEEIYKSACERTAINSAGNPNINYVSSILESWHKQGVKTLDDITKLDNDFKKSKKSATVKKAKPTNTKNRFINFEQRDYDFEELEKQALKRRLEETKKLNNSK